MTEEYIFDRWVAFEGGVGCINMPPNNVLMLCSLAFGRYTDHIHAYNNKKTNEHYKVITSKNRRRSSVIAEILIIKYRKLHWIKQHNIELLIAIQPAIQKSS